MEIKDRELKAIVEKHQGTFGEWREGQPVEVFMSDGFPCVKYESGSWWHYDLQKGKWF